MALHGKQAGVASEEKTGKKISIDAPYLAVYASYWQGLCGIRGRCFACVNIVREARGECKGGEKARPIQTGYGVDITQQYLLSLRE